MAAATVSGSCPVCFLGSATLPLIPAEPTEPKLSSRPPTYIRFSALPSTTEQDTVVEYDLDEMDHSWLTLVNNERVEQGHGEISADILELLLDRLEKEWYQMSRQRRLEHYELSPPMDDTPCAVCGKDEIDAGNALVFCDSCNLAVHQDCYGIPSIPEGVWLCRKCLLAPDREVQCVLCPIAGGALKQTDDSRWAHVQCAMWIPEVSFANPVFLEPIDSIEAVPKARWKLTCSICHNKQGACIQCDKAHCFTAYHIICAQQAGAFSERDNASGAQLSFCLQHTLDERASGKRRGRPPKHAPTERLRSAITPSAPMPEFLIQNQSTNLMTAHMVVPTEIFNRLCVVMNKYTNIAGKRQFVSSVCKYWTLKRIYLQGTPLLKRYFIESFSFDRAQKDSQNEEHDEVADLAPKEVTEAEMKQRELLQELERSLNLANLILNREKHKLELLRIKKRMFEYISKPIKFILLTLLKLYEQTDRNAYFAEPVSSEDVPDYADVIHHPMDFQTIRAKLEANKYNSLQSFQSDVFLIASNAMKYNLPKTSFYRAALHLKETAERLGLQAKNIIAEMPINPRTGCLQSLDYAHLFSGTEPEDHHGSLDAPNSSPTTSSSNKQSHQRSKRLLLPLASVTASSSLTSLSSEDEGVSNRRITRRRRLLEEERSKLTDGDVNVGDRVIGRWSDGEYYPGTITHILLGPSSSFSSITSTFVSTIPVKLYRIAFDDGYEKDLNIQDLRRLNNEKKLSTDSTDDSGENSDTAAQQKEQSSTVENSKTTQPEEVPKPSSSHSRDRYQLHKELSSLMDSDDKKPYVEISKLRKRDIFGRIVSNNLHSNKEPIAHEEHDDKLPSAKTRRLSTHTPEYTQGDIVWAKPMHQPWLPSVFQRFSTAEDQAEDKQRSECALVYLLTSDSAYPSAWVPNAKLERFSDDPAQMLSIMNKNKFATRRIFESAYQRALVLHRNKSSKATTSPSLDMQQGDLPSSPSVDDEPRLRRNRGRPRRSITLPPSNENEEDDDV